MQVTVLLADITNPKRGEASARQFHAAGVTVYFFDGDLKVRLPELTTAVELPTAVDLGVFHANDRSRWNSLSTLSRKTILYRGTEPTFEENGWINRAITAERPITSVEAEEIVAWVRGGPLPAILQPRLYETELVLCLLCQAYIALHADPVSGIPDFERESPEFRACATALQTMGWHFSDRESASLNPMLLSHEGRATLLEDFRFVSDADEEASDFLDKIKMIAAYAKGDLQQLADCLSERRRPEFHVVAATYDQLISRLGARNVDLDLREWKS